jgi:hypothetical protein
MASADNQETISVEDTGNGMLGGYDYGEGLDYARGFADALLQAAPDRYGTEHTPLMVKPKHSVARAGR